MTHEEYFALLAKSDVKLEYHGGEIVAMAGAQPAHNMLAANFLLSLGYCLKKLGCYIFTSDQLIRVNSCDKYIFPDLVIVCDKPVYEKSPGGLDALMNPGIIIEVLSDSTERYDRTEKFDCYKTIPSLREYVMVSSRKQKVEVVKKLSEEEWLSHTYTEDDENVLIRDCMVVMSDIYDKVDLI